MVYNKYAGAIKKESIFGVWWRLFEDFRSAHSCHSVDNTVCHVCLKVSRNMHCRNHKRLLKRMFSPAGIILLLIGLLLFHLIGHHVIRRALGYVYTPPALSSEKIIVYNKFVKCVQAYPEYRRVQLNMFGGRRAELYDPSSINEVSSKGVIDDDLFSISSDFKRVGCLLAVKDDWYIVFMPQPNYILPTNPGVLYSLEGKSPNDVDDEFINSKKPFFQIKDSWFTSRALAVNPLPMSNSEWRLPKRSIFDHSLKYPSDK